MTDSDDLLGWDFWLGSRVVVWMDAIKRKVIALCGYRGVLRKANVEGYSDLVVEEGNRVFRVRFRHRIQPRAFTRIEDQDKNDVSALVEEFAGPGRSFYGIRTTPTILGFKELTVFFRSSETVVFGADDPLRLCVK